MRKWLALLAAALTVGCGPAASVGETSVGGSEPDEPTMEGPVSGISLPIVAGTDLAKVIVRRSDVYDPPAYYDPDEDAEVDPPPAFTELFRYIVNIDPSTTSTINLPYGNNYTIEVIARDAVGKILAYYKSDYFNVPGTLAPAIPEQTLPALTFPDIYVGLEAPFDKYTVAVNGLGYPFGGSWSLTSDGANPLSTAGATATFASPATAGTLDFVGKFHLDGSLLIGSETASSWELEVTDSHDPLPFGGVTVIP